MMQTMKKINFKLIWILTKCLLISLVTVNEIITDRWYLPRDFLSSIITWSQQICNGFDVFYLVWFWLYFFHRDILFLENVYLPLKDVVLSQAVQYGCHPTLTLSLGLRRRLQVFEKPMLIDMAEEGNWLNSTQEKGTFHSYNVWSGPNW